MPKVRFLEQKEIHENGEKIVFKKGSVHDIKSKASVERWLKRGCELVEDGKPQSLDSEKKGLGLEGKDLNPEGEDIDPEKDKKNEKGGDSKGKAKGSKK